MSCPFADVVKATAPVVAPKTRDIIDDFYPRMFKQNPETKAFFNLANQFADPPLQRMALANAVVAYASNIDNLAPLLPAVATIAHKHVALGVQRPHYSIVHKNLMESIAHVLGSEVVTPEIGSAWSEAVLQLAKILTEEEEKLYQMAEGRRGGWRGVKDFKISGIRAVTDDCKEFTFEPVEGPGPIDFSPGQFLTVHLGADVATPRHYSVTCAPGNGSLQCCVKRADQGLVSGIMHGLSVGAVVGLSAPFGTFGLRESGRMVLISAGIGATPMKSLLESAPERVAMCMHVDKSAVTHPFREEMLGKAQQAHFHHTGEQGRPEPEKLVDDVLAPFLGDCSFYLCGPTAFLSSMKAALAARGATDVLVDVFGPELAAA